MKQLLLCLCATLVVSACGKKGNPLPPLQRIPAVPAEFSVARIDDQIYVRLLVPTTNIDGVAPSDVARVEVYGLTTDAPASALAVLEPSDLRALATLVAAETVRPPLPALPVAAEGVRTVPMPQPAGHDQGAEVIVREQITPEITAPVSVTGTSTGTAEAEVPRILVAPPGGGVQRHYFAVSVSARGRYGPQTATLPVPLISPSGAPSRPEVEVSERSMTLKWTPPANARGTRAGDEEGLLPARSLLALPNPTTYDVYEVSRDTAVDAAIAIPRPLTPTPIAGTEFTQEDITLGRERCFYVRAVDVVNDVEVRGPASPVQCASFADVFPPAPAADLVAVAVPGAVNLLWAPSVTADVVGYLVLRGEAGSATLTPLTASPVVVPSYRDESATRGVRYVYAVVAVDGAGNRSAETNRVEETAQ